MSKKKEQTNGEVRPKKHLSQDERITIQTMLDNSAKPYEIAQTLNKSPSTIIREIRNHTKIVPKINDCRKWSTCGKRRICIRTYCNSVCKKCDKRNCWEICRDYEKDECPIQDASPHVCNGCDRKFNCGMEKRLYKGVDAHTEYKAELQTKRIGFDLTEDMLDKIDQKVSPLLKAGHSPYSVIQTLGDELPCSEATLYRLIDACALSARNVDLQERVKRKPRKRRILSKDAYAIITAEKKGHLWTDYLKYIRNHGCHVVQLDCVEGKKEDKAVLLTLHWVSEHMQLYFIMDNQTSGCVVEMLDRIETAVGTEVFREAIPILLTDNGHEFMDVKGMERSCIYPDQKRTNVFFCEPNRPDEKGHCERNHRLLRKVIPKGTSLEPYDQRDITVITNHVNSYVRKSLGGMCPYDLAMERLPEDFFDLLGLELITRENVNLTPMHHGHLSAG